MTTHLTGTRSGFILAHSPGVGLACRRGVAGILAGCLFSTLMESIQGLLWGGSTAFQQHCKLGSERSNTGACGGGSVSLLSPNTQLLGCGPLNENHTPPHLILRAAPSGNRASCGTGQELGSAEWTPVVPITWGQRTVLQGGEPEFLGGH